MYICKYCGKEFKTHQELGGHINFCKDNPNRSINLKKIENNLRRVDTNVRIVRRKLKCKYCDREVSGEGCLFLHERSCKKNPNRVKRYVSGEGKSHQSWNKGKTALEDERIKKCSLTRKENASKGLHKKVKRKHSETTKSILRQKMIQYIKTNGNGEFGQHYSVRGCEYIDKLNKEMGWNLQHAQNGGEFEVDGFFLDGYDKDLNIAFEYDERKHYKNVYSNILKDRDIERQKIIMDKLNCRMFRYNEVLDMLYEV